MNDFVGRGWAFPIRTDTNGGIALVGREREVAEAIRLIVATSPGERPMRPEFGCRIHDFVFAPADAMTAAAISDEVARAVTMWEHRVDVDNVDVLQAPEDQTVFYIDIHYRLKATNSPYNLVFPFYVIPGE
ncbi:MAG TPA: GPW/gp25 family protein [Candidatus Limnocylindrales bacterium]|nr:GPW/gp25 family protein [Candidatus Limnocylindrales bacterium]